MPTIGLLLPSLFVPRRLPPGVWLEDRVPDDLPDLYDVFVSDDLDALRRARERGVTFCAWLCLDPAEVSGPEEAMLPLVHAVFTPSPTVVEVIRARWPALSPLLVRLPRSRRRSACVVGERSFSGVDGCAVWTGRGLPKRADVVALLSSGCPVLAPARGVLPDLVAIRGGALAPDWLGHDDELLALGALEPGPARGSRAAPLLDAVATAWWRFAEEVPVPAIEPERVPREIPRAQVALLLESVGHIRAMEPGEDADRWEIRPRRRAHPVRLGRWRPVRVWASMIVGAPRPTLPETLASLVGHVDGLAVVYTAGEADMRLRQYAQAHGITLREEALRPWNGDFSLARNRALDLCEADYALIVDDDERLVGGEALRALLESRQAGCLALRLINLHPRGDAEPQILPRVVRLDGSVRFEAPLHETLEQVGAGILHTTPVSRPFLVHYGYADPWVTERKYQRRNLEIARRFGSEHHRRMASVRLRDAVAAVVNAGASQETLIGPALDFQRAVIAPGHWHELLAWGRFFGMALERLGRGFRWSPELPAPGAASGVRLELAFLYAEDLQRFVAWWAGTTLRRLGPDATR